MKITSKATNVLTFVLLYCGILPSTLASSLRVVDNNEVRLLVEDNNEEHQDVNAIDTIDTNNEDRNLQSSLPICSDSTSWVWEGKSSKDCGWVFMSPDKHCMKKGSGGVRASEACPVACGPLRTKQCDLPTCDNDSWTFVNKGGKELKCDDYLYQHKRGRCRDHGDTSSGKSHAYEHCSRCGKCDGDSPPRRYVLCIYSEVAEGVKMEQYLQTYYKGDVYPDLDHGHAAIMLYDISTGDRTTWGNWPDDKKVSVGTGRNNGAGSDIRENYKGKNGSSGDIWSKKYYPFLYWEDITEAEKDTLLQLVNVHTKWTCWNNCASFASETFHAVTGTNIDPNDSWDFETPREIGKKIREKNGGRNLPKGGLPWDSSHSSPAPQQPDPVSSFSGESCPLN